MISNNKGWNPGWKILLRYFFRLKGWNVGIFKTLLGSKEDDLGGSLLFISQISLSSSLLSKELLLFLLLSYFTFISHIRG